VNQDLQATHEILALFEKSKSISDQMVDHLHGVFVNIDKEGNILRANRAFSKHFGLSHEDVLNLSISKLFSPEGWKVFQDHMQTILNAKSNSVEFELPIEVNGVSRSYLWQINKFYAGEKTDLGSIFTCIGSDISDMLNAHAKVLSLSMELEVVDTVQKLFLPPKQEFRTDQVSIAVTGIAANVSSGDFWWYEVSEDNKLLVLMGDVTGHGVGAAMVTALVAGCVSTLRTAEREGQIKFDMPLILRMIHQNLKKLPKNPYWMSMTAVEVDLKSNRANWWGATPPTFYFSTKDDDLKKITPQTSSPLGSELFTLSSGQFMFQPGDRLILLSDGVFEMSNQSNQMLGERALEQFMKKQPRDQTSTKFCKEIHKFLLNWRGPANLELEDDVTVLIIDRL
jgi:PAS domain S-box-containing protein